MKIAQAFRLSLVIVLILSVSSCDTSNKRTIATIQKTQVSYPDWVKSANIYEVNIRQFTPEGTFKAFVPHIARLKNMGVDILWLMPVHPIGVVNRKGSRGSYYSVQDYKLINPEFGSPEDFKNLVEEAHRNGMYVIIDWVANHTSWDNVLMERSRDFYTKDSTGKIISPVPDWTDVADLDYTNHELWEFMTAAMLFYVQEYKIDGYRCDVAGMVPLEFWQKLRATLNEIKPIFMLAEDEKPALFEGAFDMDYGWNMHHIFNNIVKGEASAEAIRNELNKISNEYPPHAIKMNFTSNHDENSWNGTEYERLGDAVECFAALTVALPGMPLVYSGQEAGLDKRLSFFDKDLIDWTPDKMTDVYKALFLLKDENPALWNGQDGGTTTFIATEKSDQILAFSRDLPENTLLCMFNVSQEPIEFSFNTDGYRGKYINALTGEEVKITKDFKQSLPAWSYLILKKK